VRQARGAEHIAVATWNQGWLTALQDVEAAVVTDVERRAAHDAALNQEAAARATFDESKNRYLAGLDTYLIVLQSQAALQNAELICLQAHRDVLSARIQLHDALGGQWTADLALGGSR
jgi:outer membrane protein TolC